MERIVDSETKRRLALSFLSSTVSRLSSVAIQFVQVPVLLHYWSMPLYGEWLILNSLPTYLAFSNAGFGNVAGNKMTMFVSGGDRTSALRVFQSCWWLIVAICSTVSILLSGALYFLPAARILKISHISDIDTKWIIFYLGIAVFLAQLEQLLQSAYRSIGRYPYGTFIKNVMSLVAFSCTMLSVVLGYDARVTALFYAIASCAGTVFLMFLVKHDIPWMEFGWKHARFSEIRSLTAPAIAYMSFPLGNALNLQGTLLAVSYALGPVSVVIFSTARTISRGALQMVQMVNSTFEPEFTLAYGAKRIDLIRSLHRRACQLALIIAIIVVSGVMTVGPYVLHSWTGGHVPPSRGLLSIMLLVVVVYALWITSATLMTSTNRHQRLAAFYLMSTAVTCLACFFMSIWMGLFGAAAALLISELIMTFYVLPNSLRMAHDKFLDFMVSMLHYPLSLKPAALLARFRRSTPEFEVE